MVLLMISDENDVVLQELVSDMSYKEACESIFEDLGTLMDDIGTEGILLETTENSWTANLIDGIITFTVLQHMEGIKYEN